MRPTLRPSLPCARPQLASSLRTPALMGKATTRSASALTIPAAILLASQSLTAMRALSRGIRKIGGYTTSEKPNRIATAIDDATGAIEARLAPWRDNLLVSGGLIGMSLAIKGLSNPLQLGTEAAALALRWFSRQDRIRRIDGDLIKQSQDHLLLPETRVRYRNRAHGILGSNIPANFSSDELCDPDNPPRYKSPIRKSRTTTFKSLYDTAGMMRIALEQRQAQVGLWQYFRERWWKVAARDEIIPKDEEFTRKTFEPMLQQWVLHDAWLKCTSINFSEVPEYAAIPEGAPQVWIAFAHTYIQGDTYSWLKKPQLRFLAARENFHGWVSRLFGFAYQLDIGGNPYAVRDNSANGNGTEKDARSEAKDVLTEDVASGTPVVGFATEGRSPRCYNNRGETIDPFLRSNVLSTQHPERFINPGFAQIAARVSKHNNDEPVYAVFMHIKGGHAIDGKRSKSAPFVFSKKPFHLLPMSLGHSMDFDIVAVEPIATKTNEKTTRAFVRLSGVINDKLEEITDDFERTRNELQDWAQDLYPGDTGKVEVLMQTFEERDEKDKRNKLLRTIVARIAAIHPDHPERREFQKNLLGLLMAESDPKSAKALLKEVSDKVLAVQYEYRES